MAPGLYGLLGPQRRGQEHPHADTGHPAAARQRGRSRWTGSTPSPTPDYVRRRLGYLPQQIGTYPTVTGRQLLDRFAWLKGRTDKAERKREVAQLLDRVNLRADADSRRRHLLGRHAAPLRHRAGSRRQPAAAHRRRADGRPRPGRAEPLPPGAGGGRWRVEGIRPGGQSGGDAVDAPLPAAACISSCLSMRTLFARISSRRLSIAAVSRSSNGGKISLGGDTSYAAEQQYQQCHHTDCQGSVSVPTPVLHGVRLLTTNLPVAWGRV